MPQLLYLENMNGGFQNTGSKRTRREGRDQTYGYGDDDGNGNGFGNDHGAYGRAAGLHPAPVRYVARKIVIEGLPEGWCAIVSRSSGAVYFKHLESGHLQFEVPPGFADEQPRGGGSGGGGGIGSSASDTVFGGMGGAAQRAQPSATEQLFAFLNAPRADGGAGGGGGGDGGDCDTDINVGKDDSSRSGDGDALSDASEAENPAHRMD